MFLTFHKSPGLIISLSLLLAAGIAIYENPQVQEWIEDSRRKVAVALHNLGDDIGLPSSETSREARQRDASTREDETPEAVERRRQARQEILERGRLLEERRRAKQQAERPRAASFDDLVDQDGALKPEASTSIIEQQANESGLRHRHVEAKAATLGAAVANPFADEMYISHEPEEADRSGASTPTMSISPPVPPKPAAYQPQALLLNTNPELRSNHSSEQLIDLTPTTSVAHSSFADDLASPPNPNQTHSRQSPVNSYWSVNEWATQHSVPAPFYSPPQSEAAATTAATDNGPASHDLERAMSEMLEEASQAGSGEHASQVGTEDLDVMSEDEDGPGISTPGSWTDVGSQVSEDLYS